MANGNIEYWYCENCEQVWANEALTQLTNIKNVVVPAKGGWCEVDGKTYYYENGAPLTGLQKIEGNYYYFHNVTGKMYTEGSVFVSENELGLARGRYDIGENGALIVE